MIYDTLQAMALQVASRRAGSLAERVAETCGLVSRLALRYSHCAVLVCQLLKNTTGRPQLHQIRESGAAIEAPDVLLLVWWPYVERRDAVWQGGYILDVAKLRHG